MHPDIGTDPARTALRRLGWSAKHESAFERLPAKGVVPARVLSTGGVTLAATSARPVEVVVQRRFKRELADSSGLPAVGDWLALEPQDGSTSMALRAVLPRSGLIARQRSYDGQTQILAANVDVALLVSSLDHDLNPRRIERYLALALDGGVTPVVVLNKLDVAIDPEQAIAAVHAIAAGTRVITVSALTGSGMEEVTSIIEPGTTAVLLGSSGVGKSTITNALLEEAAQTVAGVREDDSRGRHTTTRRELFVLAHGGLLIDTPGLRTVGVTEGEAGIAGAFGEIDALARECRFPDCAHETEPGCAVRGAIDAGTLTPERFESHQKLEAERRSAETRADERARREAERQVGRMHRRAGRLASRYKHGE